MKDRKVHGKIKARVWSIRLVVFRRNSLKVVGLRKRSGGAREYTWLVRHTPAGVCRVAGRRGGRHFPSSEGRVSRAVSLLAIVF